MNVIVDSSVWSLALRRKAPRSTPPELELIELIREGRVLMLGPIRQELLSGVRSADQLKKVRDAMRAFSDVVLEEADYEEAASCFNRCRAKGIQGSNTDFLICAVALLRNAAVLTSDDDFAHFTRILHVNLHALR